MMKFIRAMVTLGTMLVLAGALALSASIARILIGFSGDATFPVECVLVFGAAVHSSDDPGPGIFRRTATAVKLLRQGSVERLIFTGGKGTQAQDSEAQVMRSLAIQLGAAPNNIVTEDAATSTWENLLFSKSKVDECTTVVAISDRYHLARIQLLADLQGWPHLPSHPADGRIGVKFVSWSVLRELAAMFYYLLSKPSTAQDPFAFVPVAGFEFTSCHA